MKFTSENLLKAMGLKVGDVIKTRAGDIFEIVDVNFLFLLLKNPKGRTIDSKQASYLINLEFEILPPVKKVGDMKCNEMTCSLCPLRLFHCCDFSINRTLFDIFKELKENYSTDLEIETIIEKRLNDGVKE